MPAWQCIYNYLDYVTDMRIVVNEKQVEKMQFTVREITIIP